LHGRAVTRLGLAGEGDLDAQSRRSASARGGLDGSLTDRGLENSFVPFRTSLDADAS
jgi:hypothetical protein